MKSPRLHAHAAHGSFSPMKCRTPHSAFGVRSNKLGCGMSEITIPRTRSGASAAVTYVSSAPQSCPKMTVREIPSASSNPSMSSPSVSAS